MIHNQEPTMQKTLLKKRLIIIVCALVQAIICFAQELDCTVNINHSQIQGTDASVFDNLKETLDKFINQRQWTDLQFHKNERITCSLNITVTKYNKEENTFTCTAMVQANRPIWNSAYTSTLYNNKDANFDFQFAQFDQIVFNDEVVDNQLTALIAFYAYLIIGMDLDTFSPMGGTDVLNRCMNLVNNCQSLGFPGWKAFEDDRNRFSVINDYLDERLKPLRQLQYDYYRKGLDEMATNAERGRAAITTALSQIDQAHQDKPLSTLPQVWCDFKKDELVNIYKGKGTQKEKETVYQILFNINPSQNNSWSQIKQ